MVNAKATWLYVLVYETVIGLQVMLVKVVVTVMAPCCVHFVLVAIVEVYVLVSVDVLVGPKGMSLSWWEL